MAGYRKLLILGGYGQTGRLIAHFLLQESAVELLLAGRNLTRAEAEAVRLNGQFPGQRAQGVYTDAADPESLAASCAGIDLVVVAASTAKFADQVARAALAAGCDYFDVQYSTEKLATLQDLAPAIQAAGRCFVTDGGFHPGLPAALIRYAAAEFDRLESAQVGSVIKVDWARLDLAPETLDEFVAEFTDFQMLAYEAGQWRPTGWLAMFKPKTMDFGAPFGRQYCLPMFLEEMRAIPELYPEIEETGFFVGGFNWFVDWLLSPVIMIGLRLAPRRGIRPMARLMQWGLETFSRSPYGTLLKLEAWGQQAGQAKRFALTLAHEDGYVMTAAPAVACLLQLLDGSARQPGLWFQAHIVEPKRLLADLERLGITINK